jgi:hypothetical protein
VLELAGCDYLTISPQLLEELAKTEAGNGVVVRKLNPESAHSDVPRYSPDHPRFLWELNDDEMAHFKLAEVRFGSLHRPCCRRNDVSTTSCARVQGIRKFAADSIKLEEDVKKKLQQARM